MRPVESQPVAESPRNGCSGVGIAAMGSAAGCFQVPLSQTATRGGGRHRAPRRARGRHAHSLCPSWRRIHPRPARRDRRGPLPGWRAPGSAAISSPAGARRLCRRRRCGGNRYRSCHSIAVPGDVEVALGIGGGGRHPGARAADLLRLGPVVAAQAARVHVRLAVLISDPDQVQVPGAIGHQAIERCSADARKSTCGARRHVRPVEGTGIEIPILARRVPTRPPRRGRWNPRPQPCGKRQVFCSVSRARLRPARRRGVPRVHLVATDLRTPASRSRHAAARDSERGVIVLSAGCLGNRSAAEARAR